MKNMVLEKIILARHYGFCMGVKRAIKIAEETGGKEIGTVNVINEIVHNDSVVRQLQEQGVGSVPSVADAREGTVIISAHGAPPRWFEESQERGLNVIDATCPLVIRIHKIIRKLIANNYQIIHFGDAHHDETTGVVGQAPPGRVEVVGDIDQLRTLATIDRPYALTTQTTADVSDFESLSVEAQKLIPGIEVFNTICNATSRLQEAVLDLAPRVDLMLVVGSSSSANSNRLRNISKAICRRAYLINVADSLKEEWLEEVRIIGITAGASTPDFLVEEVIKKLLDLSEKRVEVVRTGKKAASSQAMDQ
ncbi:MAG: 4-hydroxy-3-methylbut-2-enyl diphosphate reductase [FCB group bacterium]|nr:4-hydroxy-3-methylbut-2-enyl diphosphate reductase [FCB group bacterium]